MVVETLSSGKSYEDAYIVMHCPRRVVGVVVVGGGNHWGCVL